MAITHSLLPLTWQVPEEFRLRLGEQVGRQRLMQADGHLLLVLHAPPSADADVREGRFFWRDLQGRWTPIDHLQAAEDQAKTARDYFHLLNRLNPLVRTTRNLYETVQNAREAAPDDRQLLLWRDRAYVVSRSAELLHSDARHALDFAIAERAEQEAESSRRSATAAARLNMLVACFFPIATLAAIFGVNLRHGLEPWDEQYGPFPLAIILGGGLLVGVILMLAINRRR
jgi:hypothetical protein